MRLSSLYSNFPSVFPRIDFHSGLNVILGEIRIPENRQKDTHNLGKSTLGLLIDYCLLREKDRDKLFMHQHEVFADFEFFLEIERWDGVFITLRRCVHAPTKISLLRHALGRNDFSALADDGWDHAKIPLSNAKEVLSDSLSLSPPMGVRDALSYSLRLQLDYVDAFRPNKWVRNADRQWKPLVMQFLGLDGQKTEAVYELAESAEALVKKARQLKATARGESKGRGKKKHDLDWLRGVLRERTLEQEAAERELEGLQFARHDAKESELLTRDIEAKIAELNQRRYARQMAAQRVQASLSEDVTFDMDKLRALYADAQVYLGNQLVRDFEAMVRFNREITEERNEYLRREAAELIAELKAINAELETLDLRRSEILRVLQTEDSLERYRSLRASVLRRQAEIADLERRAAQFQAADEAQQKAQETQEALSHAIAALRSEIHSSPPVPVYQRVQHLFSAIVRSVTDKGAVLSTQLNTRGNPEFNAEILGVAGEVTSESDGHTYRRLMCIAFDLAVMQAREDGRFVRWGFHDGVLETLDDRKKYLLVEVLRGAGVQQIVTAIDSDLPSGPPIFHDNEIVRLLHDDGEQGLLFRMPAW